MNMQTNVKGREQEDNDRQPDRHRQILLAAADHFTRFGYNGSSLDAIAHEVGINKASIYYHFRSKEQILATCLAEAVRDLDLALRYLCDVHEPARGRLRYFFFSLACAQSQPISRSILYVGVEALNHQPAKHVRAFARYLARAVRDVLRQGVLAGQVRSGNFLIMSSILFGAFNDIFRWYNPGSGQSLDTISDTLFDLCWNGLLLEEATTWDHAPAPAYAESVALGSPPDKRHQIAIEAASIFAQKGFEAATMNEISSAANLQKSTLYHHFRDKIDILEFCISAAIADIETRLSQLDRPRASYAETLQQALLITLGIYQHPLYRVFNFVRSAKMPARLHEQVENLESQIRCALERIARKGVETNQIRAIDAPIFGAYVIGVARWVPHWFGPGRETDLSQTCALLTSTMLRGLGAPARAI